ncbi:MULTISPECIES: regulatory protein RecX [unclassified Treponema]|jgi:regulatory protein|uniref:regulatory protein RecX n=1 Tax=unclassified Treponema TaxID=2638727 RepID=UPI0025D4290E|nr:MULTISPECIES: regulatory protein RecX [unclassified Treponema]MBQ8679802.1 regulatory protein RecX [Treponema sp.]
MTEEISNETVKSAIQVAARSLARTEQCRASLERKLRQKEFDENSICQALDFLEKKRYLDDERYASSWVRNHCAFKPQGSIRLIRELCVRGVSKDIATRVVKSYFETVDETELCHLAFQKLVSKNKSEQKIIKSLADSGFSYKIIQWIFKNKEGFDSGAE